MREARRFKRMLIQKKADEYSEKYCADIQFLDLAPYKISSSEIRSMVKNSEDISNFVPMKVKNLIEKNKLYR